MLKLKIKHTARDVKVLTDQLVDAVSALERAPLKVGQFTIAKGTTATTVVDPEVAPHAQVFVQPTVVGELTVLLAANVSVGQGEFTVFHQSDAVADRDCFYVVFGR